MLPDFLPDILDRLTSRWKRRGATLLLIGEESLSTPGMFSRLGFDVEALENCRGMERKNKSDPDLKIHKGNAVFLPYDDGEFDYSVLMFQGVGDSRVSGKDVLAEALRVSRFGVLVLEANALSSWSLGRKEKRLEPPFPVFPWRLWDAARKACPERGRKLFSAGILPIPARNFFPSLGRIRKILNCHVSHIPIGRLLVLEIQWEGFPLTPSGLIMKAADIISCGECMSRKRADCAGMSASRRLEGIWEERTGKALSDVHTGMSAFKLRIGKSLFPLERKLVEFFPNSYERFGNRADLF